MLKNYLTIAVRSLLKNKIFSAINILGLSIGISASLVIFLLVNHHFSFDKFEKDGDRLYRVVTNFSFPGGEIFPGSGIANPMGAAIKKEFVGLDAVISFRRWDDPVKVTVPATGNRQPVVFKKQEDFVFADSNYFNMVGYTWVAGSPKTAFDKPYNTVLTESLARQYFPAQDASQITGKEIFLDDSIRATISGVVKDISRNTDFTFKAFMSYTTLENTSLQPESWTNWGPAFGVQQLFIKLSKGNTPANVEKQIAQLYARNYKKKPGYNRKTVHLLQPLHDLHFNADYSIYNSPTAHKPTLYGLLAVAAFLLILGCINFINLTTAYASQRAKEIGIRKTMGSSRRRLIAQFLSETFLLTLLSTILSIAITPVLLKAFSGFIPEGLHFDMMEQPGIILFLFLLVITVTLLSGFYPALVLSGYKPVLVLKNQAYANAGKTRNVWLRKSLTVSQFVIAQVFIMGAILVSKQITYSLNKDLGFTKDAIVYLNANHSDSAKNRRYLLLDKLKAMPEVAVISLSSSPPSSDNTWGALMKYKDGKKEIETEVQHKFGDTNYIKLYKLRLIAGTNLDYVDTVKSWLINETYARVLGFQHPQEALGKLLEWSDKKIPITGIVSDFHQKSLHEPIKPLAIGNWANAENLINIALNPPQPGSNTWKTAIGKIEKAWKTIYPEYDFEYAFFDEDLAKYYTAEQNISKLLMWTTGLAILISCLGLLGLVIYTTTQRTKEIGVRKVLGASVPDIVTLIAKEFILLVLLAFVIASPLAWMGMNKWLENFAYRTSVSWWIFLLAGAVMIVIALFTLGFQTAKAAMANPVKSLRTE